MQKIVLVEVQVLKRLETVGAGRQHLEDNVARGWRSCLGSGGSGGWGHVVGSAG